MWWCLRTLALTSVVSLAFGSLAWGYGDDYGSDQVGDRAYHNGLRGGASHGRYDRSAGYRYDIHSQQYNDARDGYERWMGSFGRYKKAFREGYAEGYSRAFNRDGYRRGDDRRYDDRRWHDRDGWR
jgi:hypothetical protein